MGEVNRILGEANLNSLGQVTVELNHPASDDSLPMVHIQTSTYRLELTIEEYRLLASALIKAGCHLKSYKNSR